MPDEKKTDDNIKSLIKAHIDKKTKERTYKDVAKDIGEKLEEKNKAYGNSVNETKHILKIFLKKYKNKDGTYTIPEEALDVIARQSRVIDKQFRLFSNPKQDLMDEDPNKDMAGYSIIAYAEKLKDVNNN